MPTTIKLHDVPVVFPFEPYECQKAYMEKVILALDQGTSALLESPTGTGKTLCLLCATIAWLRTRGTVRAGFQDVSQAATSDSAAASGSDSKSAGPAAPKGAPKIYYSSRTHSQLKQVIKELRQTGQDIKSSVLGSRDQLCVNKTVNKMRGAQLNAVCRQHVKAQACGYYKRTKYDKEKNEIVVSGRDIEDLFADGLSENYCPYYKVRHAQADAEIVFVPYSYLIDPRTRHMLQLDLTNSILIFDEGHNIERFCEDASSFELTSTDIQHAQNEIQDAIEALEEGKGVANSDMSEESADLFQQQQGLFLLRKNFLFLQEKILNFRLETNKQLERRETLKDGMELFQLLDDCEFKKEDFQGRVTKLINVAQDALSMKYEGNHKTAGSYLDKFLQIFASVYGREYSPEDLDAFRVYVYESTKVKTGKKSKGFGDVADEPNVRTFCFWCFTSSVAISELRKKGARNILVTSGTLSPLDSMASTLGAGFDITLSNKHAIDAATQIFGGVCCTGPNGFSLNSSYSKRSDENYLNDLGRLVVDCAKVVPDGILLAFHSYAQMSAVLNAWKKSGITLQIEQYKELFEEPRGSDKIVSMLAKYSQALDVSGGAVLAAVCRGKLCEGMDFTDRQCRGVIVAGMPYPSLYDKRVMLKKEFMNDSAKKVKGGGGVNGQAWYLQEMIRAVNQTIGRVVRHSKDYGAVIFADERFAQSQQLSEVSSWIRPSVKIYRSGRFSDCLNSVRNFFINIPQELRQEGERRAVSQREAALSAMESGIEMAEMFKDGLPAGTGGSSTDGGPVVVAENHMDIAEVREKIRIEQAEKLQKMEELFTKKSEPMRRPSLNSDDAALPRNMYGITINNPFAPRRKLRGQFSAVGASGFYNNFGSGKIESNPDGNREKVHNMEGQTIPDVEMETKEHNGDPENHVSKSDKASTDGFLEVVRNRAKSMNIPVEKPSDLSFLSKISAGSNQGVSFGQAPGGSDALAKGNVDDDGDVLMDTDTARKCVKNFFTKKMAPPTKANSPTITTKMSTENIAASKEMDEATRKRIERNKAAAAAKRAAKQELLRKEAEEKKRKEEVEARQRAILQERNRRIANGEVELSAVPKIGEFHSVGDLKTFGNDGSGVGKENAVSVQSDSATTGQQSQVVKQDVDERRKRDAARQLQAAQVTEEEKLAKKRQIEAAKIAEEIRKKNRPKSVAWMEDYSKVLLTPAELEQQKEFMTVFIERKAEWKANASFLEDVLKKLCCLFLGVRPRHVMDPHERKEWEKDVLTMVKDFESLVPKPARKLYFEKLRSTAMLSTKWPRVVEMATEQIKKFANKTTESAKRKRDENANPNPNSVARPREVFSTNLPQRRRMA